MRRQTSRRAFLASAATATGLLAGCSSNTEVTTPAPDDPVASAAIPDAPDEYQYATMGASDAPLTVDYYGNWKCPYCGQFSKNGLGRIVTEYVQPGDVKLRFRALTYLQNDDGEWQVWLGEDAARASEVGLAVWNAQPEAYWPFHETVMGSQGNERTEWATFDALEAMATSAGVENWSEIEQAANTEQYRERLLETSRDASRAGISGTPTLDVDGQVVSAITRDGFNEGAVFAVIDEKV
jgi:protein-disulfide isomerase